MVEDIEKSTMLVHQNLSHANCFFKKFVFFFLEGLALLSLLMRLCVCVEGVYYVTFNHTAVLLTFALSRHMNEIKYANLIIAFFGI